MQIWKIPVPMMRASAKSFPAVKTSCTRVAQRTLAQLTHVKRTTEKERGFFLGGKKGQNKSGRGVTGFFLGVGGVHSRRQAAARSRRAGSGTGQVGKRGCRT